MSVPTVPLHHGMFVRFVVLSITRALVEAQKPSPPPGQSPNHVTIRASASTLGVMVAVAALVIAVYSLYIIYFSRAIAATGGGSLRAARARRMMGLRGLNPAVIDTFPVLEYSAVKGLRLGKGALECAVCLNEFEDHEALRLLTKCDHVFHPDCIDEWLAFHTTCPVCRAELDPQSGESAHSANPPVGTMPSGETSIQVVVEDDRNHEAERVQDEQEPAGADNTPSQNRAREPRSVRTHRFTRSHSTGHSLVQPGQDTERFTLRLPIDVRQQVIDRAAAACAASSSGRGNCTNGEGSSRGRYVRWPQVLDRAFVSDRWVFTRISSIFAQFTPVASPRMPSTSFVEGGSLGRLGRAKGASCAPARSPV